MCISAAAALWLSTRGTGHGLRAHYTLSPLAVLCLVFYGLRHDLTPGHWNNLAIDDRDFGDSEGLIHLSKIDSGVRA